MKRVLMALAILGLACGGSAFAANEGPGCGLGYMLFKGQTGILPMTLPLFERRTHSPWERS